MKSWRMAGDSASGGMVVSDEHENCEAVLGTKDTNLFIERRSQEIENHLNEESNLMKSKFGIYWKN